MPELPEVETVRRALADLIVGRRVTALAAQPVTLRRPLEPEMLRRHLLGRRFLEPRRRGKFLLLDTDPAGSLLVHLGMSGRLHYLQPAAATAPHTHVVLSLDDVHELRYVDPRRFGLVTWLAEGAADPSLDRLGLEPLRCDLETELPARLRGRAAAIKSLLLDQRIVAGVGNIYAAEALWRARICPTRPARRISRERLANLAVRLREVLEEAIEQGGTTIRDFASPSAASGLFAVRLDVYGRGGKPCPACSRPLRSGVIGGRSTVWCSHCQR